MWTAVDGSSTNPSGLALDLPQVDCVSAEGARDVREVSESERPKSRVDLFRLQKIEFNLHNVGAKK